MKKSILFVLFILLGFFQKANAQCAYSHVEVGNTTTLSYLWPIALIYSLDSVRIDFGDGNSILQVIPVPPTAQHTYANPGVYNVCLTRYLSMLGNPTPIPCTFCDSIYIGGLPTNCTAQAGFFFVNNGLQYNFISSGTCINCATQTYTWDFGDGTILSNASANVNHTYATPGFYNVCLTVNGVAANSTTCSNTSCQAISVVANPAPCNSTASYTSSINAQTASFTNNSTCFNCAITSYVWDFGDGSPTNNTPSPTHTYAAPGTYTVCLTTTGMDSMNVGTCVDDTCMSITIAGIPNCTAVSNFTNVNNVNVVQYTSTGTCTGCSTVTYAWNFGDGGTSSLPNPTHTYAANGNYNVCLTLSGTNANNQPCSNQLCRNVMVSGLGVNNFVQQPLSVYPNPANDWLYIDLPATQQAQRLRICDMFGRVMQEVSLSQYHAPNYALKLPSITAGLYTIQLSTDGGTYCSKVYIQQ
ncbi:MAG: PKD domain-containing protein [Chitinophagaceae bacterium]